MPIDGQETGFCNSATAFAIPVMAGSALLWHGLFLYTNRLNDADIETGRQGGGEQTADGSEDIHRLSFYT